MIVIHLKNANHADGKGADHHPRQDSNSEGGPRDCLIPDFLIGDHAFQQANQLIAHDRGYLRRYFKALKVIEP